MKFDYGDEVWVRSVNDAGSVVETRGVVVSITPVESDGQATHCGHATGSVLYTIEFGDGTDALISEGDLRAVDTDVST
jgi:hypothetical protein